MKTKMIDKFLEVFGSNDGVEVFFAPGRVNLIGEHTDYNGGHVFPCALTIGTYAVVRKRSDRKIRFYSMNLSQYGVLETSLDDLVYKKELHWCNYPMGVVWAYKNHGLEVPTGFEVLYYGNIPNGSGLSSSASIEVLTGYYLKELYGFDINNIQIALYGQEAENQYIGVNCGIMDQFAIAMGQVNKAIFLDTSDLSYTYAPIELDGAKIVIANTNKKRGLHDSKYNQRRSECETALEEIKQVIPVNTLGDLTMEQFEEHKMAIASETRRRRAKHAVYENQRTIQAVKALEEKDLKTFGELMIASHVSLRDDYEVTGVELDTIVDAALTCQGVIGARMTGAGFGGCAVSIVKEEEVDSFIDKVGKLYLKEIGYKADFYVVEVGAGPKRI